MRCYVLAGGQSRRFGEDKLLYKLKGKTTVERTLEAVIRAGLEPYLVAKDSDKFKNLQGIGVVEDLLQMQTPLVGLYTAMRHCDEDSFLLLAGDMPLVKPSVIEFLVSSYEPPTTVLSVKAKLYPTFCVYSTSLLDTLEDYMEAGHTSLKGFLRRVGFKEVIESDIAPLDPNLTSLLNMNTKEDMLKILKYIKDEG